MSNIGSLRVEFSFCGVWREELEKLLQNAFFMLIARESSSIEFRIDTEFNSQLDNFSPLRGWEWQIREQIYC